MNTDHNALMMHDLPCSVTVEDISQFFHGYGLIEGSVKIGKLKIKRSLCKACVLLNCNSDAKTACNDLNKQQRHIGGRPIKLFYITAEKYTSFDLEKSKQSKRSVSRKNQKDNAI